MFSIGAFYAPPKDANPWIHVGVLLGGLIILGGAPLVIHRFQRPRWRTDDDSHFPVDNLRQQAGNPIGGGPDSGIGGSGSPKGPMGG